MLLDFVIGFLIAFAIFAAFEALKSAILKPLRRESDISICTVLYVRGEARELEFTLRSIESMRRSGRLNTRIYLRDCGMDEEARNVAKALESDGLLEIIT